MIEISVEYFDIGASPNQAMAHLVLSFAEDEVRTLFSMKASRLRVHRGKQRERDKLRENSNPFIQVRYGDLAA